MTVTTSVPVHFDRSQSPKLVGEIARAMEASGAVDYFQTYDQLTNLLPNALWTPDVTPLAELSPDCDSFADGLLLAAFGMAATEGTLGLSWTTDAVRRGPAELAQSTLTLANATSKMVLMLGAGELKQCRPYGYKRLEGLARLEDHLRLLPQLFNAEGPIDFEGNHWNYKGAWIGGIHPHKPKVWAMGGGPKLIEMAAKYADGISASSPCAIVTPEDLAKIVVDVKKKVEEVGRDPDAFEFSLWIPTFLHDDPAIIDQALDNKLVKAWAAVFGRFHHDVWADEGIDPIMPKGFHYALKAIPTQWAREECDDIVSKVTRPMAEKSVFTGPPADVAKTIGEYVEAGATHIAVWDFGPMVRPVEEAPATMARALELCRLLKG
ncbi:LLM class flavin-dependent oxidoreductase [Mycobacterium sp. Aquia_216]|uniref:LLM class flavin-dependent oxidoreductase n=1 Tax=Mycobacterium sp. Aquia_216 TaxID=2991729 RepID=UPI00227B0B6A|nr:LLM class flavin-dependent oxidoreductase [Mycobacterium sp. Aquia_216]WAJ45355.1 LLM class flavin-dependent oxidoreductase [Mycobacterium sp. Aquia_216]